MSAQHTPGPWRTCPKETGAKGVTILQADGRAVAHTRAAWDHGDVAVSAANGRLIAAAPELLEALKLALDHMQASIETCRRAPNDIALVRAAIAKATGGAA